jgi:cyclophilin family peptidyl-prolyl cis-trans isomerase
MVKRIGVALVVCFCLTQLADAQVVRFETTAGNFDMVVNPTKDPRLQGYVDNFLHYVNTDRYLGSWVARAADDPNTGGNFVLQMGGFFSATKRMPLTSDSTRPLATYDPVAGVPAASIGLSNTVGTVSLALPSDPQTSQVFRDAGTSSFFINAANNKFLDPDFTVFAKVSDMTVVNKIMNLQTKDFGADPAFGDGGAFSEVPVQSDGFQVFIKRAFLVTDTLSALKAISDSQSVGPQSASGLTNTNIATSLADNGTGELPIVAGGGPQGDSGSSSLSVSSPVPEPATLVLAIAGVTAAGFMTRRRR